MSRDDLTDDQRETYDRLPADRKPVYLDAMVHGNAIGDGRAVRVPSDPARRRLMAEAMNATPDDDRDGPPCPFESFEPTAEDRTAAVLILNDLPVPSAMERPAPPRRRRPMRPISDRDIFRTGAV